MVVVGGEEDDEEEEEEEDFNANSFNSRHLSAGVPI